MRREGERISNALGEWLLLLLPPPPPSLVSLPSIPSKLFLLQGERVGPLGIMRDSCR